jgi:hypothetical protein
MHACYKRSIHRNDNSLFCVMTCRERICSPNIVKRKDHTPTKRECEELVSILSKETDLPISIDRHYKFLVLLPLEANEMVEVLKHYLE